MQIDSAEFISILVQGFPFISVFAGIAASVIMFQVTKKFGTGILADGFRSIANGVLFIALGIIVDAAINYFHLSGENLYSAGLLFIEGICFVVGTYIIVIGSKKMAEKLESLTQ